MVQVDAQLCGDLTQVLIGGPLEKIIHEACLRPAYTRTLNDDEQTHCKSPMYNASELWPLLEPPAPGMLIALFPKEPFAPRFGLRTEDGIDWGSCDASLEPFDGCWSCES